MATVQELAKQARYCFEFTGEDNPTKRDNIWVVKDGVYFEKPDWLQEMIRDAGHHNSEILPDDWCYEMVVNALDTILEADENDNINDYLYDTTPDYVSIYNHELIEWLGSHNSRIDLVDEALEDWGTPNGIMDAISRGQRSEIDLIFQSVYQFLANLAEETEDDDGDSA